jgi:hypothetical protein|tara:strand:+ start:435 stop:626 length:192 start_codon:yes stop_codon:yes gene_type:complete
MPLPELMSTTSLGGTIHKYAIPGGKHSFERYLACFLGSCKFCSGYAEATDYVHDLQERMILKS